VFYCRLHVRSIGLSAVAIKQVTDVIININSAFYMTSLCNQSDLPINGTASDVVGSVSLTLNCRTLSVSNIVTPIHTSKHNDCIQMDQKSNRFSYVYWH